MQRMGLVFGIVWVTFAPGTARATCAPADSEYKIGAWSVCQDQGEYGWRQTRTVTCVAIAPCVCLGEIPARVQRCTPGGLASATPTPSGTARSNTTSTSTSTGTLSGATGTTGASGTTSTTTADPTLVNARLASLVSTGGTGTQLASQPVAFPTIVGAKTEFSYRFEYQLDALQKAPGAPGYRIGISRNRWIGNVDVLAYARYSGSTDYLVYVHPESLQQFMPEVGDRSTGLLTSVPKSYVKDGETYNPFTYAEPPVNYRDPIVSPAPDGFWMRARVGADSTVQTIFFQKGLREDAQLRMLGKYLLNVLFGRMPNQIGVVGVLNTEPNVVVDSPNGRVTADLSWSEPCSSLRTTNCRLVYDVTKHGLTPRYQVPANFSNLVLLRRQNKAYTGNDCIGAVKACHRIIESQHDAVLSSADATGTAASSVIAEYFVGMERSFQGLCASMQDEVTNETNVNVPQVSYNGATLNQLAGVLPNVTQSAPSNGPSDAILDIMNSLEMKHSGATTNQSTLAPPSGFVTLTSPAYSYTPYDSGTPDALKNVAARPNTPLSAADFQFADELTKNPGEMSGMILVSSYQMSRIAGPTAIPDAKATAIVTNLFTGDVVTTDLCGKEEAKAFTAAPKAVYRPDEIKAIITGRGLRGTNGAAGNPIEIAGFVQSVRTYATSATVTPVQAVCDRFACKPACLDPATVCSGVAIASSNGCGTCPSGTKAMTSQVLSPWFPSNEDAAKTAACGGGKLTQTRTCTGVAACGGTSCAGQALTQEFVNTKVAACPNPDTTCANLGALPSTNGCGLCPVGRLPTTGQTWSNWDVSDASLTASLCVGESFTQHRTCLGNSQCGGATCVGSTTKVFTGGTKPKINEVPGDWTPPENTFSSLASCGGGNQVQTRFCGQPNGAAQCGGVKCSDSTTRTVVNNAVCVNTSYICGAQACSGSRTTLYDAGAVQSLCATDYSTGVSKCYWAKGCDLPNNGCNTLVPPRSRNCAYDVCLK